MHAARYAHTLTVLPDGRVLAIGGGVDMNQEHVSTGERSAEIWDPTTGAWTTVAPADAPRAVPLDRRADARRPRARGRRRRGRGAELAR